MKFIKIKTWEQMEKEYGMDCYNEYIVCEFPFLKQMERSMPRNRIIKVKLQINNLIWRSKNGEKYYISHDMTDNSEIFYSYTIYGKLI